MEIFFLKSIANIFCKLISPIEYFFTKVCSSRKPFGSKLEILFNDAKSSLRDKPIFKISGLQRISESCLGKPIKLSLKRKQCFSYFDGVVLRIPGRDNPTELGPVIRQEKMFEVYKENLTLHRTVELKNVGDLNLAIERGLSPEIIMVSEAMQEKQVAKIAEEIANGYKKGVRIVLISGPSSSGKTTFCKRLEIQLITNLLHPVALSLDDYFLNREDTPRDETGDYDFESLYSLDLPY